mgnify:CR=1 FL=1
MQRFLSLGRGGSLGGGSLGRGSLGRGSLGRGSLGRWGIAVGGLFRRGLLGRWRGDLNQLVDSKVVGGNTCDPRGADGGQMNRPSVRNLRAGTLIAILASIHIPNIVRANAATRRATGSWPSIQGALAWRAVWCAPA